MPTLAEKWIGSLAQPVEYFIKGATIREEIETSDEVVEHLTGYDIIKRKTGRVRRYITFTRTLKDGTKETVVDMPDDALTRSCDEGRHGKCLHRRGGYCEGGVTMKGGLPGFTHRCGCICHRGYGELELEF